jgi:hypothetical protein
MGRRRHRKEDQSAQQRQRLDHRWAAAEGGRATHRPSEPPFVECYEAGLARHPIKSGFVQMDIVIGLDGTTTGARNHGSVVPDTATIECVRKAFGSLHFPAPESRVVHATTLLDFRPDQRSKVRVAP